MYIVGYVFTIKSKEQFIIYENCSFLFFFFVLGTFIYFKFFNQADRQEEAPITEVEESEIQAEP